MSDAERPPECPNCGNDDPDAWEVYQGRVGCSACNVFPPKSVRDDVREVLDL